MRHFMHLNFVVDAYRQPAYLMDLDFFFSTMKVKFFQDIGIRDDAIGKMLVKFPPLLTYSLYKKIRPVVRSLSYSSSNVVS